MAEMDTTNTQPAAPAPLKLQQLPKLRRLGPLESFSVVRHVLDGYNNVGVTATHTLTLPQSLATREELIRIIYSAAAHAVSTHPILAAVPVTLKENGKEEDWFVRLPSVDLKACVSVVERKTPVSKPTPSGADTDADAEGNGAVFLPRDIELDDLIAAQHNIAWRKQIAAGELGTVWRLVILLDALPPTTPPPSSSSPATTTTISLTAAFLYHHSLGDGGSGPAFQRSFARGLEQSITSPSPSPSPATSSDLIVRTPSTLTLYPSLETSIPLSLSYPYLTREFLGSILPSYLWPSTWISTLWGPKKGLPWTAAPVKPSPITHFQSLILSASATEALRLKCRANGCSITALLLSALAKAILDAVPPEYGAVSGSCPVSMRRLLPQGFAGEGDVDELFGMWVAALDLEYTRADFSSSKGDASSKSLLPAARHTSSLIKAYVARGTRDLSVALLGYISNIHRFVQDRLHKQRARAFEVSNLGAFKKAPLSGVDIGRVVFSQSANATGDAISVSAVTGGDGCLTLGFSWQEGVVGDEVMESVVRGVEGGLGAVLGSE